MYVLKNICFVCLTDNAKNLKTVLYKETEDETCTRIQYALPELEILNSEVPVYICTSCSITLRFFYTFKRKCLENYNRWKHYINILQETSDTQKQSFSELQIRLTNCAPLINQKPKLSIEVNIKEENEDSILAASETEEQIFSDLQVKIDDIKPLIKLEPDLVAEQEEIFTIKLNIKDENEDAFQSSDEQNHQKTVVEDNIVEESLSSEESTEQELIQEPEFVNVIYEPVSDDEQDGGSSIISVDKNAVNKGEVSFINNTDSQNLKCILCNEMCSDKSTFETHVRNHINNVTGSHCLICKKTLTKYQSLKHHMKSHFGIKDHKCTICHREFTRRHELNLHLKVHAGGKDVMCEYCNKKFVNLKNHMNTHLGIKIFECTICGKKLSTRSGLRTHLQGHVGIKDHECTVCNKKFMSKSYLKLHNMRDHLGIKAYKCTICSKTFVRNDTLKIHMNIHAGILNFECTICNKKFVSKNTLSKHMKCHLNSRNYECTICEKKYVLRSDLYDHMEFFHLSEKQ